MSILAVVGGDFTNCKKLIAAGAQLSGELHVCVLGESGELARQLATVAGVDKVLEINQNEKIDTAEAQADILVQLAKEYQHLVALADTYGKNVMPRIAALCDRVMVSDVTQVISDTIFAQPMYAGNAIAEVEITGASCLTIRSAAFDAAPDAETPATLVAMEIPLAKTTVKTKVVERKLSVSDRPELASAAVIVSGGRGLGSKESFDALLTPLADKLNAAVGASRAAVDAGYVSNDYQVGQTGKIVAPNLYIAVGISGAIQHLAGIQNSKVIVAINKDEEAPIFAAADYGLSGDLFTLVPELCNKLGS